MFNPNLEGRVKVTGIKNRGRCTERALRLGVSNNDHQKAEQRPLALAMLEYNLNGNTLTLF